MAKMPDIFSSLVRDWDRAEHAITARLPHHHAAPETPAPMPATMAEATAATPQEEPMSVITDLEEGYAAAKAELAKVEAALPGALAKARQLEGNPLADLAVKAAESILPPEAVAIINSTASKVFDELISLYSVPAAAAADPAQAPAGAPADGQQAAAPVAQ